MGESELFDVIEGVSDLYATLMGMVITVNFAMVAAVWGPLRRAGPTLKLAAFMLYLTGMGLLGAMLVQQAHVRDQALAALRMLEGERSPFIAAYLATQQGGWFALVWLFQHIAPLLLVVGVAWLLFGRKQGGDASD